MPTADLAGKLAALHDAVAPPPVPWWPPAPGVYALIAVAIVLVGWVGFRIYRRSRASAYRRIALRRLAAIRVELADAERRASALADLAALIRRAALEVAPRERVAALSGEAWLAFLDTGIGGDAFQGEAGQLLLSAPYQPAHAIAAIPRSSLDALCTLVERWLRMHATRGAYAP